MQVFYSIPPTMAPTALTIGSFDGVHLGHQALLAALKSKGSPTTVLTFSNHPYQVLTPHAPHFPHLTCFSQKLQLLEECGIDTVIAIAFTLEFANIPFDTFLLQFSLTHLLLGKGSSFGKMREGTEEKVVPFAKKEGFIAEYLPKIFHANEPISSRRIRACIAAGDIALAETLLGRPLSTQSCSIIFFDLVH
jgi:riboflavin kinase/FMN adenylyltransferase